MRTRDGCRPIEALVAGDEVLAFDELSGTVAPCAITGISKNTTEHLVTILADGEALRTTRLHDFWVEDRKEWMPAWRLWAGMMLRSPDGRPVPVKAVEVAEMPSDSYNLEVEYAHTFFVGRQGVLVHNGQGRPSAFESTDAKPTTIYEIVDMDTGKTIYVGQTAQVDAYGNVSHEARFQQHLNSKDAWKERNLKANPIMHDKMTAYEAAVWEKHYIEKYKIDGHELENKVSPISEKKFKLFQGKHSPCQ